MYSCKDHKFLIRLATTADIGASVDLLGKTVSDLESGITIGNDSISGTLNYVSDYTGFSGNVAEQSGNYLALHIGVPEVSTDDYTVQVRLIGGDHGAVTLDSDGIIIFRIKNVNQKVEIVASADGQPTITKVYSLKDLVLEAA